MPAQWGAVGQSVQKATGAAAKLVATMKDNAKQWKDADTFSKKLVLSLKSADRLATSLAKSTQTMARNLKDATKSLLSWGTVMGLISGVLGAGGLFGIARMASSASAGTATALQTGSTFGGAKAAEIAYGQLLGGAGGVESILARMAKEKESGGLMFRRLGMTEEQFKGKAPTDILGTFLESLKTAYLKAPKGAEAKAMETLAPGIDFGVIKQLSQTNLSTLETFYQAKKRELDLSRSVQDRWMSLDRTLDAAGTKLKNTFINALTPLTPALERFSKSINKAIDTILSSPMIKGMITGAGKGLETFARYLGSEDFSNDLKSFIEELKKIGQAMADTAQFLHSIFGDTEEDRKKAENKAADVRAMLEATSPAGKAKAEREAAARKQVSGGPQKFSFAHEHKITIMDSSGDNKVAQTQAVGAFGNIR